MEKKHRIMAVNRVFDDLMGEHPKAVGVFALRLDCGCLKVFAFNGKGEVFAIQ